MSVWKPKIWRSGGVWICSYYRNSSAGAYSGPTPSGAYDAWKWRDELRQKPLPLPDDPGFDAFNGLGG